MNISRWRAVFATASAATLVTTTGCYAIYTIPVDQAPRYADGAPAPTEEGEKVELSHTQWVQVPGHDDSRVKAPLHIVIGPASIDIYGRNATAHIDPTQIHSLQVKQRTAAFTPGIAVSATFAGLTATALILTPIVVVLTTPILVVSRG